MVELNKGLPQRRIIFVRAAESSGHEGKLHFLRVGGQDSQQDKHALRCVKSLRSQQVSKLAKLTVCVRQSFRSFTLNVSERATAGRRNPASTVSLFS